MAKVQTNKKASIPYKLMVGEMAELGISGDLQRLLFTNFNEVMNFIGRVNRS